MKLYAQIGHGVGEKVSNALEKGFIDGAIFSPKDLQRSTLEERLRSTNEAFPSAELYIDPQFFTSILPSSNLNAGHISDWEYYRTYRRNQLENVRNVQEIIRTAIDSFQQTTVTGIITPNIYVSNSLNSIEGVIAKSFLREAKGIYAPMNDPRPLYASLIISREALHNQNEFDDFLNDITMLDSPPDGIYLIIAGRASDSRQEIYHTDIISNWMLLNLSLERNGIKVINGYSDLMSPFLGSVGAFAGATGWWSNLRTFSLDRFFPVKAGGRQPVPRYLSKLLLNRITINEKAVIETMYPDIINGLSYDQYYEPIDEELRIPSRTEEILQSWEALKSLNEDIITDDIYESLGNCFNAVAVAQRAYINCSNITALDPRSNNDHIAPLMEGIARFRELAGLA